MKKLSLILTMVLFVVGFAVAQRTITGIVGDAKGDPMVGASVLVKGTTTGVVTDVDGKFSVNVPKDASTLVFSFAGYTSQEVTLSVSNAVNVNLAEAQLQEVVVTALGIRRDKKALGYATTTVDAKDIAGKPESDVARALAGKSPGVNIVSSAGLAGSGTKINIRGVSTISGDAQPLWIVDGVPVNTAANDANSDFRDGQVTPTRNLDIDPNNIESMSVLRGLSATTLYGSQGRNGVILITTKTGAASKNKKMTASFTQSFNTVEAFIPEFQNKWANGFDGDYGEFFSNWGSLFENPGLKISARHPYWEHRNLFPEYPEFQAAAGDANGGYKPVPAPDNIKNFFQKGNAMTTSFNAGMTGEFGSFNVSFSRLAENGYIKNNNLERYNATIGGTANLTKRLSVTGNFSFIKTDFKTPPVAAGTGSNSEGGPSVFASLFYIPRNIDLMNWPYKNPLTGASVYYRNGNDITNPRWLLENAGQGNNVNRFLSSFSANYSLTDWLKATYRLGLDSYNEEQSYFVNRGAVGFPVAVAAMGTGLLRTTNGVNTIYDHSFILSGNRTVAKDFDLTANVGVNGRQDNYRLYKISAKLPPKLG